MKKPLIVIAGPTAVGKSDTAIRLAKRIGGEIISADSMQIYKELNIGTAKVTEEEKAGVTHHMLDVFNPDFSCDVALYKEEVKKIIDDILSRGKIPILCGGTGFYIQAVTRNIDFTEEEPNDIREKYTKFYEENGEDALFEKLREVDEESTLIIPKQNIKRVIRALEFYEVHNKKISDHNREQSEKESTYNLAYFVINMNRKELYERIDMRVDIMMNQGLLDEVKSLIDKYDYSSSSGFYNAIGYKEIIEYLDGQYDLDRAVELIKQNSRHYAKRQITFFKREKDAIWLDRDTLSQEEILEKIIDILKDKSII